MVDQGKCRSPIELKSLMDVTKVARLNVQVISFSMHLIFSLWCVPRLIYPFLEKFGSLGKVLYTEKAIIIDRGTICSAPESTGSKLQF